MEITIPTPLLQKLMLEELLKEFPNSDPADIQKAIERFWNKAATRTCVIAFIFILRGVDSAQAMDAAREYEMRRIEARLAAMTELRHGYPGAVTRDGPTRAEIDREIRNIHSEKLRKAAARSAAKAERRNGFPGAITRDGPSSAEIELAKIEISTKRK